MKARILLVLALCLIVFFLALPYVKPPHEYEHTITTTPLNPAGSGKAGAALELGEVPWVKLTVLVDNNPNPFSRELIDAWGLSILVETPSNAILFDAGPDPRVLRHNSKALAGNLKHVGFIIVSHEHGDHVGGLEYVAEVNSNIIVCIPGHMSQGVEKWIKSTGLNGTVRVYNTVKLASGVAVVGELYGPPYEQALAVNVKGLGLIVLVGCSHPGVDGIVEKATRELGVKPYAIIGGFHLAGAPAYKLEEVVKRLISLGVKRIYPIHCSGEEIRELLRSKYPEHYGEAYVGFIIEFN